MEVGVYEAKTHLARLLDRVARGETITITRHGKPVAVLQPIPGVHAQALEEVTARLAARRRNPPAGRERLSTAEILSARDEGRR